MSLSTDHLEGGRPYLITFAVGVLLHVSVFRHGEWDLYTARFIVAWVVSQATLTCVLAELAGDAYGSYWEAFLTVATYFTLFGAGITSSILVYRSSFHRLNRFPGPFAARLSNLHATFLRVKGWRLYQEVQKLHREYGDIVRLGPSELSIANPKAFRVIHSNSSPCTKGPWYNIIHPMVSLQTERDKKEHSRRRKAWDKAFNAKALRDYEPRVVQHAGLLLDQIEKTQGQPFNATQWIRFYTFDIMGDLAFGQGFGMLRDGVAHWYLTLAHTNMAFIGAFGHLVWLFPIFKATPGLNSAHIQFQKWLAAHVEERRRNKPAVSDVFAWILEDYDAIEQPTKQEQLNLYADANLISVAGSDTTAATMTNLFYYLALNPGVCRELQEEIDEYKEEHQTSDHASLAQLKFLQACIDETLRLHPVVPSGLQRMTPPEGIQIDDTFIPGNTLIQFPSYTMYRDERSFVRPDEFIPERWTSKPELTKDSSIYAPFSVGRYSCVGKQLGLMEIRHVITETLSRYSIRLAPGVDPQKYVDIMRDYFTLEVSDLEVVFTSRA
ncbi:hypothetical protein ACJZ2D_005483 [Fusarium nematophilum]